MLGGERVSGDREPPFNLSTWYGPKPTCCDRLAYVEMRLTLARLVFHFDMETADESRDWLSELGPYNLWYKTPLYVRIKAR